MRSQLVKIQVAVVTEDVVYGEFAHHLLGGIAVDDPVFKFLVVTEGSVIYTYALYLDIGLGAVDGDLLRRVLPETE